jgi:hypothetical protein
MDRRTFLGTLTGGLLAAPVGAGAQQPAKAPQIGYIGLGTLRIRKAYASVVQSRFDVALNRQNAIVHGAGGQRVQAGWATGRRSASFSAGVWPWSARENRS